MKTITSIRFTGSDLTGIKFDLKDQRILNLYQQPLVPGLIVRGEVTNISALAAIIKTHLIQTHSLGSDIAIGLPEERALLGIGNIQGIPKDQLGEAMKWQAEEIFPGGSEAFYIDWQAAPSPSSQALFVAAPKSTVDGFVKAIIQAGAKPLACEPASISLAKLVPLGETSLVAEIRNAASIIVLVDSTKIVRFSTIIINPNQLISEMQRLMVFYEQKHQSRPSKIYVCGEGATTDWLAFIAQQLKIPSVNLPLPPVANLPQNPIRFAVSLSLTTSALLSPSHPETINLLPRALETEYAHQEEKKQLSFGFKASITATILTSIIMSVAFIQVQLGLSHLQQAITAEEQVVQANSYNQIAKKAEAANALARNLQRLPAKDNSPAIISSLYQSLPQGVSINTYTLDLPQKVLLIDGFAPTRDLLLTFKSNLESSDLFNIATIPLRTLEHKNDVDFSIIVDLNIKR